MQLCSPLPLAPIRAGAFDRRIEWGRLAANLRRFLVRPDSGQQPGSNKFYQLPWLGELPRLICPYQAELFTIMLHLYNSTSNTGAGNAHAF